MSDNPLAELSAPRLRPAPGSVARWLRKCFWLIAGAQFAAVPLHLFAQVRLSAVFLLPALLLPVANSLAGQRHGNLIRSSGPASAAGREETLAVFREAALYPLLAGTAGTVWTVVVHLLRDVAPGALVADLYLGVCATLVLTLFSLTCYLLAYRNARAGGGTVSALLLPLLAVTVGFFTYEFSPQVSLLALLSPLAPAVLPVGETASAGPLGAALDSALDWLHFFDIGGLSIMLPLAVMVHAGMALLGLTDFNVTLSRGRAADYRILALFLLPALLANLFHATLTDGWLQLFALPAVALPPYLLAVSGMSAVAGILVVAAGHAELDLPGPHLRPPLSLVLYPAIIGVLFMLPAPMLFTVTWPQVAAAAAVLLGVGVGLAVWSRLRTDALLDLSVLTAVALAWFALTGV